MGSKNIVELMDICNVRTKTLVTIYPQRCRLFSLTNKTDNMKKALSIIVPLWIFLTLITAWTQGTFNAQYWTDAACGILTFYTTICVVILFLLYGTKTDK